MKTYRLVAAALLSAFAFLLQLYNDVIGIPTGFGMTVDLVGVPVLLAFFVLGYEAALYVLVLLALLITFASPTSYIGAIMKFAATLPMILVPSLYLIARKRKMNATQWLALFLLVLAVLGVFFAFSGYLYQYASLQFEGNGFLVGLLPFLLLLVFSYVLLRVWRSHENDVEPARLSFWQNASLVLALAVLLRGIFTVIANFYFAGPLFFKVSPAAFAGFVESAPLPFFGASAWYWVIFFWNTVQGIVEFALAWLLAFKFRLFEKYGA